MNEPYADTGEMLLLAKYSTVHGASGWSQSTRRRLPPQPSRVNFLPMIAPSFILISTQLRMGLPDSTRLVLTAFINIPMTPFTALPIIQCRSSVIYPEARHQLCRNILYGKPFGTLNYPRIKVEFGGYFRHGKNHRACLWVPPASKGEALVQFSSESSCSATDVELRSYKLGGVDLCNEYPFLWQSCEPIVSKLMLRASLGIGLLRLLKSSSLRR